MIQKLLFYFFKPNERIIIFLIDGASHLGGSEKISGGITSIDSIYNETKKLKSIHHSKVYLATLRGLPYIRFSTFKSHSLIFRFSQFINLPHTDQILLHIPEYLIPFFNNEIIAKGLLAKLKQTCKSIHVNILNQNIELMPGYEEISKLQSFTSILSQTTAHKKYSGKKYLNFNIESFHFSTRLDPIQYKFTLFHQKEKLIIFSPDDEIRNKILIEKINNELPEFKHYTISGISYEEYKKLISKAMFCITLGEGLDGYFVETIFSGGITFAVFNNDFFTEDYRNLSILFPDFTTMVNNIIESIKQLANNEEQYYLTNKEAFTILSKEYNYQFYQNNIKQFYKYYYQPNE